MAKTRKFEAPKLVAFEGDLDSWLDQALHDSPGFLKKDKTWSFLIVNWEKSDNYFLNVSTYQGKGLATESVWITRKDAKSFIESRMSEGYKLYK